MDTDRNLLFGVLALQLELIDAKRFSEGCAGWAAGKERSLAQLLVERGWITEEDKREVERVLERKLNKHGGDVRHTLGSVAGDGVRAALGELKEPAIRTSLDGLPPASGALTSTVSAPPVERSRYTITRLHAEGGLGRIFVAQDQELNREVALKEIKPQQAQHPEACRRFLTEAQVTGQLEHPNIVPVYELSRRPDNGVPFYTMRLVRGQTLRAAIADYQRRRQEKQASPLELPKLLGAFVSICQAVAFAHARGVLHRDLKPDNVLLGSFGEVVVLDWGLAKMVDRSEADAEKTPQVEISDEARPEATAAGRVLGTPAYMSPEQAAGRLDLMDARTDVYGLGAILFEVLTGKLPHEGRNTAEVLLRTVTEPTPRARAVDPAVSPALEAVCAKAMAKERNDRYARATELADDVQRYLADEPVSAYRESWSQRLARWLRRHRAWTLAAAGVLLAVIVTTSIASVVLARLAEQERESRIAAERLRAEALRVAAKFAARTIAGEIDLRWWILEAEADDDELRKLLALLQETDRLRTHPAWEKLQAWLQARADRHAQTTKAASWFISDRTGVQLARSPLADTIGQNYAFRDYFHGLRREVKPEETRGLQPIHNVHRSNVFESRATNKQMVAFSVPIWSGPPQTPDRRVLGVLAMTVELGHFSVLHLDLSKDQIAVLVDTTKDWVERRGRQGLILQHPRLEEMRAERLAGVQGGPQHFRLEPRQIEELEKLRAQRLQLERELEKLPPDKQLLEQKPIPGSMDRAYRDPVGGAYEGLWIAAFEPVFVRGRPEAIKDTGWVVIVQERLQGAR